MEPAINTQATDPDLVLLASQGDKSAFQLLYQRHYQRVYALCFRMAANPALAEELCQDCFIRVWKKIAQFDGKSEFSTWLHQLCVRQSINSLKAHQRFWQRFLPQSAMSAADAAVLVQHKEYHQLDKLIMRLPERMRVVFVLYALEGYQHDEIASLLNIADGTSKNQYFKAKKLLQEMLK